MNETGYYVSVAIPFLREGEWWHERREAGPVETVGEIWRLLMQVFAAVVTEGRLDVDAEQPGWHGFVVDGDGSRRQLTEVEKAALVAAMEQRLGGTTRVRLVDCDDE